MILETERLFLRELTQADFKEVANILQNPNVMYAYEHDFSDQDVQDWLDRQRYRYQKDGFGLWAMIEKESQVMVGQAGLTLQDCKGETVLEIGYLLKEEYWHQGYAYEATLACKQYAFTVLQVEKVHAIIKSDNLASIKVASKIGLQKEKEIMAQYYNGKVLHYVYSATKQKT